MPFAHRVRQSQTHRLTRLLYQSFGRSEHASNNPYRRRSQSAMATKKARTIKVADLTSVIDQAVEASAGRRLPGGTIIGRQIAASLAAKINPDDLARDITKQLKASFPDATLTPKVIKGDDLTTIGFIMKVKTAIR